MTQVEDAAQGDSVRPGLPAGSAQRHRELPAHPAQRESDPDHRLRLPRDRRRAGGELEALGLNYHAFVLEDLAPRPLADMPAEILDDMETSDVSIFAVKAQPNELRTRMQMTDVVNRRKMRHAHMVNIDRRIMLEGMRADFDEVDRISTQVWQMASRGARNPRHQSGGHRHRRRDFRRT